MVTTWNAAAERIYGDQADEMIGRRAEELMPDRTRAELRAAHQHALSGQRVERFDSGHERPELPVRPLRVLLVEDSPADADLLVEMLQDELPDAVVLVTATLAEARPLLAQPLDIVITDLSLPDADGLEALTAILAARPDIAVLVMTGHADQQLALEALSAGAEDFLIKGSRDAHGVATAVLYANQRRHAEQATHGCERLAVRLLDSIEASTCAVDGRGDIVAANRAWRDFGSDNGGDGARTSVGVSYLAVCDAATGPDADAGRQVAQGLRQVLSGSRSRFELDYACPSPQQQRWMSVRITPLPESGAVLSHVDMTAAKRAEEALSHLSLHDALTDLPNRNLLMDRLTQALTWSTRSGSGVAVGFLDLDQFKRVNDTFGHAAGDELLCQVAARLRRVMRAEDTFARFSGDEFVVVWPGVDEPGAVQELADRLMTCFADPFALASASLGVTASVGLAVGRTPQTADDLLHDADAAMYEAKRRGRAKTRLFTEELRQDEDIRLRTEAELRIALEQGELVLHYQPVVDLTRNVVTGLEALVRWQHPDGLRMPDAFLPVAEASGLILPLGAWVLEEGCRQAAVWEEQGLGLQLAVNVSTRQISHPAVVSDIERALRRSGLPPHRLLVEVTESTMMEDAELAQVALTGISALGVGVAIDDFGTGYSSLLYLKRYPINAIKIDRAFVGGIGHGDDDAIVASVISLARAVGAACIAEGVETAEQRAALVALGCHYAQGHLFGRAVPADQVGAAILACAQVLAEPPVPRAASGADRGPHVPAAVVQRTRQLHEDGASLQTIVAALNREGLRNPDGRRWHTTSVAKVIARMTTSLVQTS